MELQGLCGAILAPSQSLGLFQGTVKNWHQLPHPPCLLLPVLPRALWPLCRTSVQHPGEREFSFSFVLMEGELSGAGAHRAVWKKLCSHCMPSADSCEELQTPRNTCLIEISWVSPCAAEPSKGKKKQKPSLQPEMLLFFFPVLFALGERSLTVFINKAKPINLIKLSCFFKKASSCTAVCRQREAQRI